MAVLPSGDVIGDLDTGLLHTESIMQRLVPGRSELASHNGLKAEPAVVFEARLVHVPCGHNLGTHKGCLHPRDALHPVDAACTPCGDDAEVQVLRFWQVLRLVGTEELEEVGVRVPAHLRLLMHDLGEAQLTIPAVLGAQSAAQVRLAGPAVIEGPPVRTQEDRVGAALARLGPGDRLRGFHTLGPIVRKPGCAVEVDGHLLAIDSLPLQRVHRPWGTFHGVARTVLGQHLHEGIRCDFRRCLGRPDVRAAARVLNRSRQGGP
mmetsp:Transcript_60640/g.130147  ORF Transcript_60640/g.130147 Transcript_60640/m.130147 type:complete len:263 (+) Transcript_60640:797-1585(+)